MAAPWTTADDAMWHTVDIAAAVATGSLGRRQPITHVDPLIAADEMVLAEGSFSLGGLLRPGHVLYPDSTGLSGRGFGGLMLRAMNAGMSQHTGGMQLRSVPEGRLYVSTHGYYLRTRSGLTPWPWAVLENVELMERGTLQVHDRSTGATAGYPGGEPVAYTIQTRWAELVFVLRALARHRGDPKLVDGSWLPQGWPEHARSHGYWPEQQVRDLWNAVAPRG